MNTFKARLLSVLVLTCLLATLSASPVQARVLAVIYVRQGAGGLNNGTSWLNAYTDLQSALAAAPRGGEIWVARGTYKPIAGSDRSATFLLRNRVQLYGGFLGNEIFIGQRDPRANVTTLSGNIGLRHNGDNSYHVVTSRGTNSSAVLDGFTISYGSANGPDSGSWGGGMYIESGSPRLENIIFSDNSAINGGGLGNSASSPALRNVTFDNNTAHFGGGMYNTSSNPTLTDVTFSSNSAPSGSGGGMYNLDSSPTLMNVTFNNNVSRDIGGGMYNSSSNPTLTDVTFNSNSAPNGGGGGMANDKGSTPALTDVAFNSNSAYSGGGIYNVDSSPALTSVNFSGNSASHDGGGMDNSGGSSPTLTNVAFAFNSAGGDGGGMQTGYSATTLTDVTFRGNSAGGNGGGLYNSGDSVLTNVTFSNNFAYHGGGMLTRGSPMLTNVTFSGNSAQNYGGGMLNSPGGSPTLTNVTFMNNSAGGYGGALYSNSELVLSNAILWGNTAPVEPQVASTHYLNINDSVVQSGCPAAGICTNIITTDPLLGTLGDYGGSTQTIPLQPGSSAIDAGDDAVCPATDQRGVPRPQGSRCDIGAYEAVSAIADAGTYDDTHPVWLYTGNWTIYTGSGPYNNTTHYTSTTGNAAIVMFTGTQFTLTYTRSSSYGLIEVYVDNALVTTINAYSPSTLWQQTYTSPVYASGVHMVRFVHAGGGTYVEVDAITITP